MELDHHNDPLSIAIAARLQWLYKKAYREDVLLQNPYYRAEQGADSAKMEDELEAAIAEESDPARLQQLKDNLEIAHSMAESGSQYGAELTERLERQHEQDIKSDQPTPTTGVAQPEGKGPIGDIAGIVHDWYLSLGGW